LGEITEGMTGGGFLYTNKDSLSLGMVVVVTDLMKTGVHPDELIERMKANPNIAPLIEGGHTKEYSAHMVPEAGYSSIPELIHDGVILVGDAALLINNLRGAGANLSITSGRLAAETVIKAKAKGDFSTETLAGYERAMKESYALKDMQQFRGWPAFLHDHPDLLNWYPKTANEFLKGTLTTDSQPARTRQKKLMADVKKHKSLTKIARELYGAWKVIK
ncbi:MAG: FAD-dependent oxidoreductase, partial [Actinomycetota bacterium]